MRHDRPPEMLTQWGRNVSPRAEPPRELLAPRKVVISGLAAPCNKLSTRNGGVNLQPEVEPHPTREDFLASKQTSLAGYRPRSKIEHTTPTGESNGFARS